MSQYKTIARWLAGAALVAASAGASAYTITSVPLLPTGSPAGVDCGTECLVGRSDPLFIDANTGLYATGAGNTMFAQDFENSGRLELLPSTNGFWQMDLQFGIPVSTGPFPADGSPALQSYIQLVLGTFTLTDGSPGGTDVGGYQLAIDLVGDANAFTASCSQDNFTPGDCIDPFGGTFLTNPDTGEEDEYYLLDMTFALFFDAPLSFEGMSFDFDLNVPGLDGTDPGLGGTGGAVFTQAKFVVPQGDAQASGTVFQTVASPEPGTLAVLGAGLVALAGLRRRRSAAA